MPQPDFFGSSSLLSYFVTVYYSSSSSSSESVSSSLLSSSSSSPEDSSSSSCFYYFVSSFGFVSDLMSPFMMLIISPRILFDKPAFFYGEEQDDPVSISPISLTYFPVPKLAISFLNCSFYRRSFSFWFFTTLALEPFFFEIASTLFMSSPMVVMSLFINFSGTFLSLSVSHPFYHSLYISFWCIVEFFLCQSSAF